MSVSSFAWLDNDDAARRRMMEVVDLFREKGTLDELGIGSIRDTFADRFFPGTSTIQTRARYFLFLPWIYTAIERDRVGSEHVAARARHDHFRLVESLKRGETNGASGIIGRAAGEQLKRLPASIYWNGLGTWGIRLFPGSMSQYRAGLNAYYRGLGSGTADTGEQSDAIRRNWTSLPPAPPKLMETVDFRLTQQEAQFLRDQIWRNCEQSLLASVLRSSKTAVGRAKACWELGDLPGVDPATRLLLEDARRFAYIMEGAVLLYNLMLAERFTEHAGLHGSDRVDQYRAELDRWSDEAIGGTADYRAWNISEYETRVRLLNPRIPSGALDFCRFWMSQAIAQPRGVGDSPILRSLIANRERQLKGGLARLSNLRALENWSGESGLGRLDYRWGVSKPLVLDIFDGLQSAASNG